MRATIAIAALFALLGATAPAGAAPCGAGAPGAIEYTHVTVGPGYADLKVGSCGATLGVIDWEVGIHTYVFIETNGVDGLQLSEDTLRSHAFVPLSGPGIDL